MIIPRKVECLIVWTVIAGYLAVVVWAAQMFVVHFMPPGLNIRLIVEGMLALLSVCVLIYIYKELGK